MPLRFSFFFKVSFVKVDELATVWCEWAEMEIRNSHYTEALKLMHRVTTPPPRKVDYHDENENVQSRVYKSLKVIKDISSRTSFDYIPFNLPMYLGTCLFVWFE